jgi:hypothetical protein
MLATRGDRRAQAQQVSRRLAFTVTDLGAHASLLPPDFPPTCPATPASHTHLESESRLVNSDYKKTSSAD